MTPDVAKDRVMLPFSYSSLNVCDGSPSFVERCVMISDTREDRVMLAFLGISYTILLQCFFSLNICDECLFCVTCCATIPGMAEDWTVFFLLKVQ